MSGLTDFFSEDDIEVVSISEKDAVFCMRKIVDYYDSFNTFEEFMITTKIDSMKSIFYEYTLSGDVSGSENFFNRVDMDPRDFDIEFDFVNPCFKKQLSLVTSAIVGSVPGRILSITVLEKTTNTILGFIKLSSPTLNMKPRNVYFNEVRPIKWLNENVINAQVLVPVQPFGFNYLGGKLIALLATSDEIINAFNHKYDLNITYFETTSLYGGLKGNVSQYDGLKPYIRHKGETESKTLLYPSLEVYRAINKVFMKYPIHKVKLQVFNGSVKNKKMFYFFSVLKKTLTGENLELFLNTVNEKSTIKTKKRYYISTDNNIRRSTDELIEYWKKKSFKRWIKLKTENRLKKDLELWTPNTLMEKIIR